MSGLAEQEKRWCHFYKVVSPSILQQKKLKLPKKFVKKFGHKLQGVAALIVPDEGMWPVTLTANEGSLCFDNGWHQFVEHCSIRAGHFLDFRYEGNSNFSVQIFDLVPYQIDRHPHSMKISKENCRMYGALDKMMDDDIVEILDGFSPSKSMLNSIRRENVDASMDDDNCVEGCGSSPASATPNLKQSNFSESLHQNNPCQSHNPPSTYICFNETETSDFMSPLSKEKLHTSEGFGKSRGELPYHGVDIHCGAIEPENFTHDMALIAEGRRELENIETKRCRIDKENPPASKATDKSQISTQSTLANTQSNSTAMGSSAANMNVPLSGEAIQKLEKISTMKPKHNFNEEKTSAPPNENAGALPKNYVSASFRRRHLTDKERKRAINAAKAFQTTNPFCMVVLRPSYLYRNGCILHLPSHFCQKHLSGVSGDIKLEISDGRQWTVQCTNGTRLGGQGWYHFYQENNLEEGDVCIFELINAKDLAMKVAIFRASGDCSEQPI